MDLDRRKFLIRGIGAAICAGIAPTFLPRLLPEITYPGLAGCQAIVDDIPDGLTKYAAIEGLTSDQVLKIFKKVYGDITIVGDFHNYETWGPMRNITQNYAEAIILG